MDSDFNVVFKGEVALDHDVAVARQKLAKAFNASDEKMAALFSGKAIVVKKGVSPEVGIKLQRQLLQLGAITYLEPVSLVKPNEHPTISPDARSNTVARQFPQNQKSHVPVVLALVPTESIVTEQSAEDVDSLNDEHLATSAKKFNFPSFTLPAQLISAILLIVPGITCMLCFSPYPDYVLRKGFAVGGVLLFIGARRLMR